MSDRMSMDELFAEAVERLLAGEPLAAIVASYPAEHQPELRKLLVVIEMTEQLATQPVPQPSPVQRRAARAMFLHEAAARRTEMQEVLGIPPAAEATPAPVSPWRALVARTREFWNALFDVPVMRLAPLAIVLLAVYLATFGVVSAAQAALPGDPVFPVQQWIWEQRIALASPDQRPDVVQDVEEELAKVMETLASASPDRSSLLTEHTQRLMFYGMQGKLLRVGPLLVAPNYQPDANVEAYTPMDIGSGLIPGVTVELVYKMLPGNPSIVQGVSVRVVNDDPKPTPPPTPTPTPPATCQRTQPQSWVPYPVQPGSTLAEIAARSGATMKRIAAVNCLTGERLPAVGQNVFVPDNFYVEVTPTNLPTAIPTLPPTRTPTATPEPPPTVTPSPEPPTPDPATEPTSAPTDAPTAEPGTTPTARPTEEPTGAATRTPEGEPTSTPTIVPTTVLTTVPTTDTTATPGTTPPAGTATVTPVSTVESTPTGEAGTTPTPAATTPAATPDTTPATTPATTGEPTATSEPAGGANATATATTAAAQATEGSQQASTPTRQATAEPTAQPTQAPTQPPPTQPPPTEPPPTPVPPTPVPPPTSEPASSGSSGSSGGAAAGNDSSGEAPPAAATSEGTP